MSQSHHLNTNPTRLDSLIFASQRYFMPFRNKYAAETYFWQKTVTDLMNWYQGDIPELFGQKPPTDQQKIRVTNLKDSAILTWLEVHQKPKYLSDLGLSSQAFKGKKLLDVGAGPIPSGLCFDDVDLYSLDPLYDRYLAVGYPLHYYGNAKFVQAFSEAIPVEDDFFDGVISVNAIDHVDSLAETAKELKRVLKSDGKFAMHVHYHAATKTEPLEITDEIFTELFGWCKGLKKVTTSQDKYGSHAAENETYVVWRNFS